MRPCRLVTYTGATIACIWMCLHISIQADESSGLFDSDPRYVSNQLYRQLHIRTDPDGKEYGFDALDPLLWRETSYLLSGISHAQALALADKFLRTHAERQITDPVKRAILQRDQSMMSFSFRGNASEGPILSPRLEATTPSKEAGKILEWAQMQEKWKHLIVLWSAENSN